MEALGVIGLLLLTCHVAAHLAVVASLREKPSHAAFAFFFPPAGVAWAWEAGRKKQVLAYAITLGAYAIVVMTAWIVR